MASLALYYLLLFSLPLLPSCLSATNIALGSSLSSNRSNNSSWLSPSGDFAFGFCQLNNSDLFLLAIWFNKIPERTIVWYANEDNPAPRGSTFELTATGLLLKDPRGQTIWSETTGRNASDAAMLNTGNFVLRASGNDSDYVWESFKNPTDTILPTQVLDLGSVLVSKLTETNFSKGRFELHFSNGSLQLNPVAWPSRFLYKSHYYSSNTYNEKNSSDSGRRLFFNEFGDIYIEKNNGQLVQLPQWNQLAPLVNHYFRATLDYNGVFTEYGYLKDSASNPSWFPIRTLPENICNDIFYDLGSGACGFNSYCSLQTGRPHCDCPPGYVFVDPKNRFSGCKPNYWQGCGPDDGSKDAEELYEIKEYNNINWPLGDYERLEPYDQKKCETSCLHDCSCAVAVFGGVTCWKKRLPLSNGRSDKGLTKVLYKVRKADFPDFHGNSGSKKGIPTLLGGLLLGGSVFFNGLLLLAISLGVFAWRKRKDGNEVQHSSVSETNLCFFSLNELNRATNGFKEELGRGSFGIVYKGFLKSNSQNAMAVKKLDKLAQEREREFKTEVSAIGRTHHKNLVQLLGYCDEGLNRLLVYEFMGNGSLANLIFAIPKPDWSLRVRISLEIARGLVYLHEECNVQIIHCDIKPQNILLDQNFTAKISDFGLSKLLLSDQSRSRTMIRGTRGYVAPEWFKNVPVSAKVDVYSFGVMLLEIICCRRNVEMDMDMDDERRAILTEWAYDCFVEGRLDVLVESDETSMADKSRLLKWLMIAMWCIQGDPSIRPTMKMVLQMLEGYLEVPSPPCPYSFIALIES